jgi:DNA-binding transcriptional LysR family regulator
MCHEVLDVVETEKLRQTGRRNNHSKYACIDAKIRTMTKAGFFELNAVVAISTHRSFRRAATELGISPSALSHAIAGLEQRMRVRLFNRTTRSVSLSEAGARFLSRVQPALQEISAAMEDVNEFRDTPSGTLRINASIGAARIVLKGVVVEFLRRYPGVEVDIATEGRLIDIVAQGFDAGVRQADTVPLDMISVPCSTPVRFLTVGAPSYFNNHKRPRVPTDLTKLECVRTRFTSGAVYKWDFARGGEEFAVEVPGSLTLDNEQLMIEAALEGVGLIWISEFAVAPYIASGHLVPVLEDWSPSYPGLCLYYPGHRHLPASLRAFAALVRELVPSHS